MQKERDKDASTWGKPRNGCDGGGGAALGTRHKGWLGGERRKARDGLFRSKPTAVKTYEDIDPHSPS